MKLFNLARAHIIKNVYVPIGAIENQPQDIRLSPQVLLQYVPVDVFSVPITSRWWHQF